MNTEAKPQPDLEPMHAPAAANNKVGISDLLSQLRATPDVQLKKEQVEYGGLTFIVHEADANDRFELLKVVQHFFEMEVDEVGKQDVIDEKAKTFAISKNQFPLKARLIAMTTTDADGAAITTVEHCEADLRPYPELVDLLYDKVSEMNRMDAKESDLEMEGN